MRRPLLRDARPQLEPELQQALRLPVPKAAPEPEARRGPLAWDAAAQQALVLELRSEAALQQHEQEQPALPEVL